MALKIKDLADAVEIEIALMRWETEFSAHVVEREARGLEVADSLQATRDLIEREPEYVARAWHWFREPIMHAASKKQIIMAWIAAECNEQADAERIYDLAMGTKISIAKLRKEIKAANGITPGETHNTLAHQIVQVLSNAYGHVSDTEKLTMIAALPAIAREAKRDTERMEEK